jgi:hypothetical protein
VYCPPSLNERKVRLKVLYITGGFLKYFRDRRCLSEQLLEPVFRIGSVCYLNCIRLVLFSWKKLNPFFDRLFKNPFKKLRALSTFGSGSGPSNSTDLINNPALIRNGFGLNWHRYGPVVVYILGASLRYLSLTPPPGVFWPQPPLTPYRRLSSPALQEKNYGSCRKANDKRLPSNPEVSFYLQNKADDLYLGHVLNTNFAKLNITVLGLNKNRYWFFKK